MNDDSPRFMVGQKVVVHSLRHRHECNGTVATVEDRRMANFEYSPNVGLYQGWVYWLDAGGKWVPERFLRPYDPLIGWDDSRSVWKPEALRSGETA